jgi:hypothetical protein
LDQKETQKILTDYNSKTHMSSLHVGLKQRKKKEKRGGVRERVLSERRSRRRRRKTTQMTGTTQTVVSMRHSSRLECNTKDGNKKMHIQQGEGNENSVPPRSPARGKKETLASQKRDSSASVETEEEEDNSSFGGGLRNENTNEKGAVGSAQQNQSEEKKSAQTHEKGNDEDEDDIETKPLSAFEQKLKNKKPISTDPKTFDPDTVLKIDEDFSKKAMSLGYELGTIKHSAYALLAMAGPGGMTVANIVSIAKRLDLYNWGTCKTPNNSVTAALSQDAHFQRVAPSTYALKEHVPDDLCTASIAHKAAHTKKKEERRETGRNATTTTSSGGGDFNMMGGGGGGHTKLQDRNYHHQKAVEQAKKRKAVAMYESEEDEYFDGPAFLFRARSETRDQENSEEENEDRYDERRENYHTRRIQHEEEPPFAYKDVAERLALECFRRRADLQPEIYRNCQLPSSSAGSGDGERTPMNAARADSDNIVSKKNAPNTVEHMVNEPNEPVNCDATVAASCLAFFPAVSTPGIVATRQRDAICATPPEPTEAFSRANLWKNEVGLVKQLEGFEAINGGLVAQRGGLSASSSQQQQQRKKTTVANKRSKLGEKKEKQQQQNKVAAKIKKSSSDNSMKSRSASGEETCYHRLPRWVLDQYMESHNVAANQ